MEMKENRERLCNTIEEKVGRRMETPQDFVWLSGQVWETIHERVSVNTLKRLWGKEGYEVMVPRRSTLDILAKFIGYRDYATFGISGGEDNSEHLLVRHLVTKNLEKGIKVRLTWLPDRLCEATYKGNGRFLITEVENSKLSVGDTFECSIIIEGEPLYLNNLIHNDIPPSLYVVGKKKGIHFEVVED